MKTMDDYSDPKLIQSDTNYKISDVFIVIQIHLYFRFTMGK